MLLQLHRVQTKQNKNGKRKSDGIKINHHNSYTNYCRVVILEDIKKMNYLWLDIIKAGEKASNALAALQYEDAARWGAGGAGGWWGWRVKLGLTVRYAQGVHRLRILVFAYSPGKWDSGVGGDMWVVTQPNIVQRRGGWSHYVVHYFVRKRIAIYEICVGF